MVTSRGIFIYGPDFIPKITCLSIQIFTENSHILYESVVIFKDGDVLGESCPESFRNFQKKVCDEVIFGKSDTSRAVLKIEISEFPEICRIANPNKTCE